MTDDSPETYRTRIDGGKHWSTVIRRGMQLRLSDATGGANVGMLLYNPANTLERYNAPDTLKCQHTFKLTQGHCLYSDMGRIFGSIVEDTAGWHDTVCGTTTRRSTEQRWGVTNYQSDRNDWQQNGLDSFLVEGGKYGLSRRDLAANINWFSKVAIDEDGRMIFDATPPAGGRHVVLRFEMDTLVLLHTCPHPLNPAADYPRRPVDLCIEPAARMTADDACLNSRPENGRGFANNRIYHLGACP